MQASRGTTAPLSPNDKTSLEPENVTVPRKNGRNEPWTHEQDWRFTCRTNGRVAEQRYRSALKKRQTTRHAFFSSYLGRKQNSSFDSHGALAR
jgi:hypothetical protein